MKTISVRLDRKLLQALNLAAKRTKMSRSALVRDTLREHLRRIEIRAWEELDRQGYARQPQVPDEALFWEAEAAWPSQFAGLFS